jgi:hypothetical protein
MARYFKTDCSHCGGHLEFPAELFGTETECPHCHALTLLSGNEEVPSEEAASPPPPPLTDSRPLTQTRDQWRYYILQNDERKGPFTIGQLRGMWSSGSITVETLYCQKGFGEWWPLRTILHELEPPATPPPVSRPPVSAGCLVAVVLSVIVVLIVALSTDKPASVISDPDVRKPSIALSKLTGTFVSSIDPRWKLQIAEAPSSGGAYGGWNGTIRLYGPRPSFDGRPFRCRVLGEILAVELITKGETTIIKMFDITDANSLTCKLPDYWPEMRKR